MWAGTEPPSSCSIRRFVADRPPLPDEFPPVASHVGIDLNSLDVRDEADVLWLRALVWPETTTATDCFREPLRSPSAIRPNFGKGTPSNRFRTCYVGFRTTYRSASLTRRCATSCRSRIRSVSAHESKKRRTIHWLSGHEAATEWDNALTLRWFDGEKSRRFAAYE